MILNLFKSVSRGSANVEYALGTGIVALGLIGTLVAMNVSDEIASFFARTTGGNVQGNVVEIAAAGSDTLGNGIGGAVPPPAAGQEQVCFSSGYCLNVPTIDESNDNFETLAPLGGEEAHQFASVLQQLAEQLRADNADNDLVSLITALANEGHNIGSGLEAVHEKNQIANNCLANYDACTTEYGGWAGVEYALWDQMGTFLGCPRGGTNSGTVCDSNGTSAQTKLLQKKQILDAYLNAPGNENLLASFPEARGIINMEVQQLTELSEGFVNTGGLGGVLVDRSRATLAHQSGNTICQTGGDTSQCTVSVGI